MLKLGMIAIALFLIPAVQAMAQEKSLAEIFRLDDGVFAEGGRKLRLSPNTANGYDAFIAAVRAACQTLLK